MAKKVSVIIPTYKRSDFLERAIESVLNQTYKNIEIVVIDDNDPQSSYRSNTEKKMEMYSFNNQVKYIKNEKNMGGALARNEGIYKASGEFITFLDDDDIYLPEKVNTQVKFMLEKDVELSFTDVRIHNAEDVLIDYREHSYIKEMSNNELLKAHIMHHLTPTATYMFKKAAILDIGGFDNIQMGQEFMLMLKSITNGLDISYFPIANVIQYIHDEERISVGENKLKKEKELYEFKKKYFKELTGKQRRYVKFRHHAVMMIVGKRSKKKRIMLKHFMQSMVTSPADCLIEVINHIKKTNKYKDIRNY